jgi:hypothetical protein
MAIWLRVLLAFIFFNSGPEEVITVASLPLALWTVAAGAYLWLAEPRPPRFFGTRRPARWAHYVYTPDHFTIHCLPWRWKG